MEVNDMEGWDKSSSDYTRGQTLLCKKNRLISLVFLFGFEITNIIAKTPSGGYCKRLSGLS